MRVASFAPLTDSPVSVGELREHLRVTDTVDDAAINSMGMAAAAHVEKATQRLLAQRVVTLRLSCLPLGRGRVELPGGPVGDVTSVMVDGVSVTGCLAFGDSPAFLFPAQDWPVVAGEVLPVVITYTAGHVTVPDDLKAAMKLIVAELYDQRRQGVDRGMNTAPVSAEYLMARSRIRPI